MKFNLLFIRSNNKSLTSFSLGSTINFLFFTRSDSRGKMVVSFGGPVAANFFSRALERS